ncbi:GTP cyclohydrolase 1 type 2 [Bacteroidia bacterium]|nr:GTP cyclohydrolase 1 type 2 [Bacteroidia bacterium]
MTIAQISQLIETVAPLAYQEHYDNAGLCVGNAAAEVTGILLCLDVSELVVEEAVALGCNLIISHHPVIFSGLKQLTGQNATQRIVQQAIQHNIALYAAHTNLDKIRGGVSEKMCEKLHLTDRKILEQADASEIGLGMIGNLSHAVDSRQFMMNVKQIFGNTYLRYNANYTPRAISRVAVCGGSGASLMHSALRQDADAFITADLKYHDLQGAEPRLLCIDVGHYESEIFTLEIFLDILNKNTTFAVHISKQGKNAVNYI